MVEYRTLTEYKFIVLEDNVNLEITNDSIPHAHISFGKNLIKWVTTEVIADTLYIRNRNRCQFLRSFKDQPTVTVSRSHSRGVMLRGGGNITTIDTIRGGMFGVECGVGGGSVNLLLNVDTSFATTYGPADITSSGKSNHAFAFSNGYGLINHQHLSAINAYVRSENVSDFKVMATQYLQAEIYYKGNIFYTGNPAQIVLVREGEGNLIPIP
jgi:hypothetical protein